MKIMKMLHLFVNGFMLLLLGELDMSRNEQANYNKPYKCYNLIDKKIINKH